MSLTQEEIDRIIDYQPEPEAGGHGWVNFIPSGAIARCGGPVICKQCAIEVCRKCGRIGLAATAHHARQVDEEQGLCRR